jgi:hypothetical protein
MAYRLDIVAVLNYLEAIAIGTKQGLCIKELVEDYMEPIIDCHVEETIDLDLLRGLKAEKEDFEHLFRLKKSWDDAKAKEDERLAARLKFKGRR